MLRSRFRRSFVLVSKHFTRPSELPEGIRPPMKPARDSLAVLNALASTVKAESPNQTDFRLINDPWLCDAFKSPPALLCKAKATGRSAARLAMNQYFPQDIISLATEVPRIDAFMPILRPSDVLNQVEAGEQDPSTGLNTCIDLLACNEAWTIFEKYQDHKWDSETLHRLLELFSRSNGGLGGEAYFFGFRVDHYSMIPFPEELFYSAELKFRSEVLKKRDNINSEHPKREEAVWSEDESNLAERLFSQCSGELSTARGFSSMIRGASKFGNINRALELFRQSSKFHGQFSHAVYHDLFAAHGYFHDSKVLLNSLSKLLECMAVKSNLNLTAETFEAISHGIAEFVFSGNQNDAKRFIPYLLGLKEAISDQCNSTPTLGFLRNMFYVIYRSPHALDARQLLISSVSKLENEWTGFENSPSYLTELSDDDRLFFRTAMGLAKKCGDLKTADQLADLVWRKQERRFMLKNSRVLSAFYVDYCTLLFKTIYSSIQDDLPPQIKQNPIICGQYILDKIWTCFWDHRNLCLSVEKLSFALRNKLSHMWEKPMEYFDQKHMQELRTEKPLEFEHAVREFKFAVALKMAILLEEYIGNLAYTRPFAKPIEHALSIMVLSHPVLVANRKNEVEILNSSQQNLILEICKTNDRSLESHYSSLRRFAQKGNQFRHDQASSWSQDDEETKFRELVNSLVDRWTFSRLILLSLASTKFALKYPSRSAEISQDSKDEPLFMRWAILADSSKKLDWCPLLEMAITFWDTKNQSLDASFWRIVKMAPAIKHGLKQDISLRLGGYSLQDLVRRVNSVLTPAMQSLERQANSQCDEELAMELKSRFQALEYIQSAIGAVELEKNQSPSSPAQDTAS